MSERPMEDQRADPPASSSVVVVKLGGSLLELPDLMERLAIAAQTRRYAVWAIVVGGGRTTDAIREYQRHHGLSERAAHDAAIAALDLNALWLAEPLGRCEAFRSVGAYDGGKWLVDRSRLPAVAPIAPSRFALEMGRRERFSQLPATWDLTSDSIAAFIATELAVEELLLLKSRPAPEPATRREAARDGGVDPLFTHYAATIPRVTWINLRDDPQRCWSLK